MIRASALQSQSNPRCLQSRGITVTAEQNTLQTLVRCVPHNNTGRINPQHQKSKELHFNIHTLH